MDGFIPLLGVGVLFFAMAAGESASSEDGGSLLWALVIFATVLLVLGLAVWAVVLFAKGTTIGKMMLGMRVVGTTGRSANFFTMLIREVVGKFISAMVCGLGFLWILFDSENQGWHDKLMATYVVESQS